MCTVRLINGPPYSSTGAHPLDYQGNRVRFTYFLFYYAHSPLTGFKGNDKESLSRRHSLAASSLETRPHRSVAGKAPESSLRMDRQLAWPQAPLSPLPPSFARVRFSSCGLPAVVDCAGLTIGLMLRTRVRSETITCQPETRSVGKENRKGCEQ